MMTFLGIVIGLVYVAGAYGTCKGCASLFDDPPSGETLGSISVIIWVTILLWPMAVTYDLTDRHFRKETDDLRSKLRSEKS